jgi:acetyltransferase-like isoleucine patch superfamily enzyme
MKNIYIKIKYIIEYKIALLSSEMFTKYLRKKGCKIGNNVQFTNRNTLDIDIHKPSLVEIGSNVFINRGFSLITHDYTTFVFLPVYKDYVGSSGKVVIGNNVAFGRNVTILKGVTIGDNCFIGFGSIVTKDIPANSIAVGTPAKVVCSLDEYYKKRKIRYIEEAFEYARSIHDNLGRRPVISDFYEEFPIFLNGDEEESSLPIKSQLGIAYDEYKKYHKAPIHGFEQFLKQAGI